ncbi:hypothetical protein [Scytonema sp. NUACC26]|uniref:hypothetical protein n=1 Tax=Scytonema sp. NUACC26 TaxID=3140176 RepID=UPI0034DBD008
MRGVRGSGESARSCYELAPEKIEMIQGKLFWTDEERITMLALLLENVGADTPLGVKLCLASGKAWRS